MKAPGVWRSCVFLGLCAEYSKELSPVQRPSATRTTQPDRKDQKQWKTQGLGTSLGLASHASFLFKHLTQQQVMAQVCGSLLLTWETCIGSLCLGQNAWSWPSCYRHLGDQPVDGTGLYVCLCLFDLKKKLNPSKIISYWYSLGLWSILRKGDWVSFVFFGYLLLIIGISLLMPVSALQEILLISVCILWLGQEQKENEDKSINSNTENKGQGNNVRVSFLTAVQQIRALRLVWGVCKNRASPPPTNHIVLMISCLCNPIM